MLILSRKKNETIVIDGQIEIEVLKIKGSTVRLGIKAPRSVKVLRGELTSDHEIKLESEETDEDDEALTIEQEELKSLPNPFAIAHAS